MLYKSNLVDGSSGYGGRVEVDLGFLLDEMVIGGTYDRLFPDCDGCTFWEAGAQVGFEGGGGYLGLGAFFSRFEVDPAGDLTDADEWYFALVGGVRFAFGGWFAPLLEIRQELGQDLLKSQTIALGLLLGPYRSRGNTRRSARGVR